MITVTVTHINEVAVSVTHGVASLKRAIDRSMLSRPPAPSTEGTLSSDALLWLHIQHGDTRLEEKWKIDESYTDVVASLTTDAAEQGSEVTTNKVTSLSGSSTDTEYPSAKLVYDQLALKAPLASPTFTGTPAAPTAADGTNTTQVATTAFVHQEIRENRMYGAATGTDTYALDLTPNLAAYGAGNIIYCTFANTNTGAATINVDTLGAKAITKGTDGITALSASDLVVGKVYTLIYDGTRFQINL